MKRFGTFWQSTGHLWILVSVIVAAGAGFIAARRELVPASFGRDGAYRADALAELAAGPSVLHSDADCLKCHEEVRQERAGSLHEAVRCVHCHGLGRQHVIQASKAAQSLGSKIDPAVAWDGDFRTSADLYMAKDRAICLVCHETKVGVPEDFRQIVVEKHLEEMGASDPHDRQACFECHGGHNTAP